MNFAALPRSVRLQCSETALSEMVRLLLQNALESQTPPPTIRLHFPEEGFAPGHALEVSYAQKPLTWIEIEDHGPGMSAETQQRLFEPLFTTREGHRGLGLARVLSLVRSFSGTIQVWSQLGQGTRVRLGLPIAVPPSTTPVVPADPVADLGQPLVLLAEDEDAVRDVIARLLRSLGCGVLPARHGEEAVTLFAAHRDQIRLALVDLSMPRLDGEPTIRRLLGLQPQLPIVLMSGYSEADLRTRFPNLPLAGYLQKPFRMPVLMEMLKSIGVIG
ncbi:MAG: response regulator [Gemmataceae bacterium]